MILNGIWFQLFRPIIALDVFNQFEVMMIESGNIFAAEVTEELHKLSQEAQNCNHSEIQTSTMRVIAIYAKNERANQNT